VIVSSAPEKSESRTDNKIDSLINDAPAVTRFVAPSSPSSASLFIYRHRDGKFTGRCAREFMRFNKNGNRDYDAEREVSVLGLVSLMEHRSHFDSSASLGSLKAP
jgi:hypothetical protein